MDLDYKGLSNCGTWMLGRLQTERDKLRVLDGLEGASTESGVSFDRKALDAQLSGMAPRTFLLQSIHLPAPVHFRVRYALSYLRGPLSRDELARLMASSEIPERPSLIPAMSAAAGVAPGALLATPTSTAIARPVLPPEVSETFLVRSDLSGPQVYRAGALAEATLRFADAKAGIESAQKLTLIAPLQGEQPRWDEAWTYAGAEPSLSATPHPALAFGPLPSLAMRASTWKKWERAVLQHFTSERALTVLAAPDLKLSGRAGEGRDAFASRVALAARERRDEEVGKLSTKWEPKIQRKRDEIEKCKRKIEDASGDRTAAVAASGLEIGASVLGAMFGSRRSALRSASSVATKARRAQRSGANKERAEADLKEAEEECRTMEGDLRTALGELRASWDPANVDIVERKLLPKKADVLLSRVTLVWVPVAS